MIYLRTGIFALAILIASSFVTKDQSSEPKKSKKIEWLSFEEAQKRAAEEPRKVFVDVYTDWCGWCKRMDANTFSKDLIAGYINENYYAVKFDAEQNQDVNFKGKVYTNKGGKYHELAAALMNNKMSYPTVVFLDEDFKVLQPIPGYHPPARFDKIMRFFAEDAYKNTSWKAFEKNYQSPFEK